MKKPTYLVPAPSPVENAGDTMPSTESRRAFMRKTGNAALFSAVGYTLFQNTAHALCPAGCSHLVGEGTSGFSWSAWTEGTWVSIDDARAKMVFECSPSTSPSKKLQVNFRAEAWVDGGSSTNVSTTQFEMWASVPYVHDSALDASVPPVSDVWVSICSATSVWTTPKAVMGGIIWVDIEHKSWYNAHLAIVSRDGDGSDESVTLVGKVYIKQNVESREVGSSSPPTHDTNFSAAEFFTITLYEV